MNMYLEEHPNLHPLLVFEVNGRWYRIEGIPYPGVFYDVDLFDSEENTIEDIINGITAQIPKLSPSEFDCDCDDDSDWTVERIKEWDGMTMEEINEWDAEMHDSWAMSVWHKIEFQSSEKT